MSSRTFHPFPRLPCELRLEIWRAAIRPEGAGMHYFSLFHGDPSYHGGPTEKYAILARGGRDRFPFSHPHTQILRMQNITQRVLQMGGSNRSWSTALSWREDLLRRCYLAHEHRYTRGPKATIPPISRTEDSRMRAENTKIPSSHTSTHRSWAHCGR